MGKGISQLTKTPFLILFVVLGAVGITTAFAGTINLSGTTIVNGTMTADDYFDSKNIQTGVNATALGGSGNIANATHSTVGGGSNNTASGSIFDFGHSTVGGGQSNTASGDYSAVSGGDSHTASGEYSTIGGGGGFFGGNTASGDSSTVGGGSSNTANGQTSTIGGGTGNTASGPASTIGGGFVNTASGIDSTVGGGFNNTASGGQSTIPGGRNNVAQGIASFAAGKQAKAYCNGCSVFSDNSGFDFVAGSSVDPTVSPNQFAVRATGGTTFVSDIDGSGNPTHGVQLFSGSNAWVALSDSRAKENISEYSVLEKLDDYRAVQYDWKSTGKHDIGVVAQELESIFPEVVHSGNTGGDITGIMDSGAWGVEYSKLGALALQAIKEQQSLIEDLEENKNYQDQKIENLNKTVESLIAVICADDNELEICQSN